MNIVLIILIAIVVFVVLSIILGPSMRNLFSYGLNSNPVIGRTGGKKR